MSITLTLPSLSPTMTEGVVAKWHVKEGDAVAPGDVLADIETDKATMEMEAVDEGRIGRILVPAGAASVPVHTPIAILLEEGEEADVAEGRSKEGKKTAGKDKGDDTNPDAGKVAPSAEKPPSLEKNADTTNAGASVSSTPSPSPPAAKTRLFASPLARRLAQEKGIELSRLQGSGPHGRIIKRDVEAASLAPLRASAAAPAVAPAAIDPREFYAPESYDEIPLDNMRRAIASRLSQSMQEAPHYYLRADCRIDLLSQARKRLNERRQGGKDDKGAARLSINDFLLRAAALTLMEFPEVNSSWAGECLLRHHHADIAIAVALPGGGLITPVVRQVESKGLGAIAAESRALIERARAHKLQPQEYQGGGFTISNLGGFGIREFTAVINPPQSSILAVGAGRKTPVVGEGGALGVAEVMTLTLSCDHRVIDGALGARFLGALQERIEDPFTLLL